jgi:hypothetical protein
MKNNFLVLSVLLTATLVGCSEGAYTPNASIPANNIGVPYQPNNFPVNPANSYPNFNNQFQANNQFQYPNQFQNQAVLSWNMRLNTPGYYYNNYQYRSCIPRKPYLTTYKQNTVRRNCNYVYTTTTTVDRTSTDTSVTTSTQTDTSVVVTDNTTVEAKVLPISWKAEDAQALYQRLAREEEILEKDRLMNKGVKARTGEHYQCIVDGNEKKAKNYVCDLEIRVNDGTILQQSPVGKDGTSVITNEAMMYKGDLLNIGGFGEAPEVGYLTIAGPSAAYLYQNFSTEELAGKVDEAGVLEAKIKTLGQVKCYKTTGTVGTTTECLIKINAKTGTALNF